MTKPARAPEPAAAAKNVPHLIDALDWTDVAAELNAHGCAVIGPLLSPEQCAGIAAIYDADGHFRSRVVMARHGYGRGEYQYFSYPLPSLVGSLRTALYPHLANIANQWYSALEIDVQFPPAHSDFIERCHLAGQLKPTPLLLRYGADDFNCLHQDVYGEHVFPLQVAILLSEPGVDFTGGEFVLTEQRPRMQSRAQVVPLGRGQGVIFPVRERPVAGTRGSYRVNMRHGVSRVRTGRRHTLGIIFHDAT